MTAPVKWLTRTAAAAWFLEQGIPTLNERRLRRLATEGGGPQFWREGRSPYYRLTDLEDWLELHLTLDLRGRAPPKF